MLQDNKRFNFKVRYCPYVNTPDSVLLTYLSSEPDGRKMMLDAARMCYSALAYKQAESMDSEQLRQLALDSCDRLEKHIWYVRMSFGLYGSENTSLRPAISDKDKPSRNLQPLSQDLSNSEVAPADVDSLFDGL